jgi:hypothetical protein
METPPTPPTNDRPSHALVSAQTALTLFFRSVPCQSTLSRLDPAHRQGYRGQTLAVGLGAQADLKLALSELDQLSRGATPRASPPKSTRARMTPRLPVSQIVGADPLHGSSSLQAAQERFESARDAIMSIHQASDIIAEALAHMSPAARMAGQHAFPSAFVDATDEMASDPLGAQERLTMLSERMLDGLPALDPGIQANRASLSEARASLSALRALRARRILAHDQAKTAIDAEDLPQTALPSAEDLLFFERWLDKLRQVDADGQHHSASVGLAKLSHDLDALARDEARALEIARAPIDELSDLRGRFDAFKAKASALSAQGRPLPASAKLLQDACSKALANRPARLSALRRAQRAFEACVSELGA